MPPDRQPLVRILLDEYIEMYSARDPRLVDRFSENFSGYAGSSDHLVKSRAEWVAVTLQDFAQVPQRVRMELLDWHPQDLGADVLAVTAFFHIHLPTADALLAHETARLVLVFRREGADWKIAHSGISIPFGLARQGEVYPLSRLAERNEELQVLVEERTHALEAANTQLDTLSKTDGLTGIANRRHFDRTLAQEWERSQRAGTPLGLIMLDVDVFKHFNDQYGHLAGDACLQALALTLSHNSGRRSGELVARFGGEEFVVLLPDTTAPQAMEIAHHIQQELNALALPHEGAPFGIVTVSLGVASMASPRGCLPLELVRRADKALYGAKQAGRNCVRLATADTDTDSHALPKREPEGDRLA